MLGAKGTGLGLSVAKSIAEAFGGSLQIGDRVPGDFSKGASFIVVLRHANKPE
jgi:signal transduction histidine kinase